LFDHIYKELAQDTSGKSFERFCVWFLENDPYWLTQVDKVWLWDDYPKRWGIRPDGGTDIVIKHKNGETWAVQAKCYKPVYSITKGDLNSFVTHATHPEVARLLLLATTDHAGGPQSQQVIRQHQIMMYLRKDFDEAKINYPKSLSQLKKVKPIKKPKPDPHQAEAIDAVIKGFAEHDRGKLLMACGTGKTYISLWIKEKLLAKRTLVLVPSLSLLSQTLKEWTSVANKPFDVLCVCSDKTVGKRNSDEIMHSVSDANFPVHSDINVIKKNIRKNNIVIFCTYHSSGLIAEAQSDKAIPKFDLTIADEAHRCAGKVNSYFANVLDGDLIRSKKRLFATATPRIATPQLKKSAADRGIEIACMDDEEVFGKFEHKLPFGEAIEKGLLADYKLIIVGVDDEMITEWIKDRELVTAGADIKTDAETLASIVALIKTINNKDYNLRRIISFHTRVEYAKNFKEQFKTVSSWLTPKHRLKLKMWTEYVYGKMSADKRDERLKYLKNLDDSECGIISNARCLSEGVDVPSLDCVAFFDPKRSIIDIVQAVGRAIRTIRGSEKKKTGYIFIPVFIENGDDPEERIRKSNIKQIWNTINALKAHDDMLSDRLDSCRTEIGRRKPIASRFPADKIITDLPQSVGNNFSYKLKEVLVEMTTEACMFW